jgi:hypothetical protein
MSQLLHSSMVAGIEFQHSSMGVGWALQLD